MGDGPPGGGQCHQCFSIFVEALHNQGDKMTPGEVRQPLLQCLFSGPLYRMDMAAGPNMDTCGSNSQTASMQPHLTVTTAECLSSP